MAKTREQLSDDDLDKINQILDASHSIIITLNKDSKTSNIYSSPPLDSYKLSGALMAIATDLDETLKGDEDAITSN